MKNCNFIKYNKELLFLPLGGSGEIGMNLNLYHMNGRWIIVDFGLAFPDQDIPGANIVLPNINFILQNIVNKIDGIVITHAHEDHIGALPYLWPQIKAPIYTTRFTSLIIQKKIIEYKNFESLQIIEKKPKQNFKIKDFYIEFIPMYHSIPEMNALYISTPRGNIFHSGDWRFNYYQKNTNNKNTEYLKTIGQRKILALVGDSTNIFNHITAKSEDTLALNIEQIIIKHQEKLILITTFASNIKRLQSIFYAALKSKRKIMLLGKALWRIFNIAQESGYLPKIKILSDKSIKSFKKQEILIVCTGCQGEPLAAMNKIALDKHPTVRISKQDLVIFSSKIIPGNEKKIFHLYNQLIKKGIKILHEYNAFVHVSGHPSKTEIEEMYNCIKPNIAIPIHGENFHLDEHCRIAKKSNVANVVHINNGAIVLLRHNATKIVGQVENGRHALDGKTLLESTNQIFTQRKIMMANGIIIISILLGKHLSINIEAPGLTNKFLNNSLFKNLNKTIIAMCQKYVHHSVHKIKNEIQKIVRQTVYMKLNKFPIIKIYLYNR